MVLIKAEAPGELGGLMDNGWEEEGTMRVHETPLVRARKRWLNDSLVYDLARFIGSPFSYDVIGFENILPTGPAVYIGNHLGAIGPLAVILSVPVRFYPWIIAEMMNFKQAPRYLFDDFVRPALHLDGWFGLTLSTLLTKISVRLLRSVGRISIDRFGGLSTDGFRESLKLLHEGKNLLIFPEDALLPLDPETLMRPFMPGFATLCSLYQADRDKLLPVYPMAVHSGSELVSIGKPEYFHQQSHHKEAINNFCLLVEGRVRGLYIGLKNSADTLE